MCFPVCTLCRSAFPTSDRIFVSLATSAKWCLVELLSEDHNEGSIDWVLGEFGVHCRTCCTVCARNESAGVRHFVCVAVMVVIVVSLLVSHSNIIF